MGDRKLVVVAGLLGSALYACAVFLGGLAFWQAYIADALLGVLIGVVAVRRSRR